MQSDFFQKVSFRFKISICILQVILFSGSLSLYAQILSDTSSLRIIKESVDNIYNQRFDAAKKNIDYLNHKIPDQPVVFLLRSMEIYWEFYPLIPESPMKAVFERNLKKCIELTEAKATESDQTELLLTDLSARCLLLLFYADNNLSFEVIPLSISTYHFIRKSFDYTDTYADFYFFMGLYNYYREAYPMVYPMYKTVAFLFPKGDKIKGLKELDIAAKNSIFLKAESSTFLSGILASFENDYRKSFTYAKALNELYPGNSEYLAMYIKALLLTKQFDEAEKLIVTYSGLHKTNFYYQAELVIFNGILHEKKYHNNEVAEQYYRIGIKEMSAFGHFGNEFSAYAYFGLSRVATTNDTEKNKHEYRKKALELADFKKIDFD